MVGAKLRSESFNYLRDDIDENISEKNRSFCEPTGLYWLWKNCLDDVIGLCHYRRYFVSWWSYPIDLLFSKKVGIVTINKAKRILEKSDIILPVKHRCGSNTVFDDWKWLHYEKDILTTREVLAKKYPRFIDSFDSVMKQHSHYYANMMIGNRAIINDYCVWLFDILFDLEKQIDISRYDDCQKDCLDIYRKDFLMYM